MFHSTQAYYLLEEADRLAIQNDALIHTSFKTLAQRKESFNKESLNEIVEMLNSDEIKQHLADLKKKSTPEARTSISNISNISTALLNDLTRKLMKTHTDSLSSDNEPAFLSSDIETVEKFIKDLPKIKDVRNKTPDSHLLSSTAASKLQALTI